MPKKSVIVYGGPDSGKSINANRIRLYFELDSVEDDHDSGVFKRTGVLYLTERAPEQIGNQGDIRVVSINEIMCEIAAADNVTQSAVEGDA